MQPVDQPPTIMPEMKTGKKLETEFTAYMLLQLDPNRFSNWSWLVHVYARVKESSSQLVKKARKADQQSVVTAWNQRSWGWGGAVMPAWSVREWLQGLGSQCGQRAHFSSWTLWLTRMAVSVLMKDCNLLNTCHMVYDFLSYCCEDTGLQSALPWTCQPFSRY